MVSSIPMTTDSFPSLYNGLKSKFVGVGGVVGDGRDSQVKKSSRNKMTQVIIL